MTTETKSVKTDDTTRERVFDAFFQDGDETVIRLKKQALACDLETCKLRIVSWKMFLGLLSTPPRIEEWTKEINKQRERYVKLKQKYAESSLDDDDDPNINNPLSLDTSSAWSKFFENEQLRKTIMQDVERTYPEYSYFQDQWVKDMMMGILFVYSKDNPEVSYKQGMHELLAPIIYILDQEKMTPVAGSLLSHLMDKNHIEEDAYIIFERLMKITGSWFISKPSSPKNNNHNDNNNHHNDNKSNTGKKTPPMADSPILIKCQHIHHNLLKAKDPGLYSYITSLKIEPQLFLLRWIRLLFGREFRLSETLTLWDAIFAYDKSFSLIDHIAVSMLMVIREQLLSADQNGVLQLLFKYPIVVQVPEFVEQALTMAKAKSKRSQYPTTAHSVTPNLGVTNPMVRPGPSGNQHRVGFPKALSQTTLNQSLPSPVEREMLQLKWLHNNVATRLDNIVSILQANLPDASRNEMSDTVLLAVAELKQIKDVMCGHLPVEALPPIQPDPSNGF